MDRESEQTLCKEDIEMANRHGKMFHTANYQGNVNQNCHEIFLAEWLLLKREKITNVREDRRKENIHCCGTVNWCNHMENSMDILQKLRIELPYFHFLVSI